MDKVLLHVQYIGRIVEQPRADIFTAQFQKLNKCMSSFLLSALREPVKNSLWIIDSIGDKNSFKILKCASLLISSYIENVSQTEANFVIFSFDEALETNQEYWTNEIQQVLDVDDFDWVFKPTCNNPSSIGQK